MQTLLVFCALALPLSGYCDAGPSWLQKISASMGGHANDVAEKIAELPDPTLGFALDRLQFSPDGSVLASLVDDKINLWDWKNRRVLRTLHVPSADGIPMAPLSFSPDGRFLALCTVGEVHYTAVRVWNASTWQVAADIVDLRSPGCSAVAFSADSRMLLRVNDLNVSSAPDDVLVYSTETWQKLWGLHDKRIKAQTLAVSPASNLVAVGGFYWAFSPDGDYAKDKQVSEVALLDLQQGKYVKIISAATSIQSMSWSPDGTRLAVLEVPGFEIFDMPSGQRVVQQNLPYGAPTSIRYSPNGKYLVINSFIGPNGPKPGFGMQIWDGQASALLQTNSVDTAGIAFSPDSRFLAAAVRGRIEIWQFK
ncbi:MAG: hypothetical protein ABI040_11850 [Rhodoferax sp.]